MYILSFPVDLLEGDQVAAFLHNVVDKSAQSLQVLDLDGELMGEDED